MTWHTKKLVAFDTETTGVDVESDRIVTAAVLEIDPLEGGIVRHEWLINPGIDIPAEATAIHGITDAMAAEGRDPGEAVAEIALHLGAAWMEMTPVVAYNASFDLTLLDRELRRYRGEGLWHGSVIDPLVIDKHFNRYRPGSRKLVDVAKHYRIALSEMDAHGAAADALAAARIAWTQARWYYPEISRMRLPELHANQEQWHAEQAASLADYFHRQGRHSDADSVSLDWPLRPAPASKAATA
ncbi:DNA polymerase III subunit epsilon [Amycolatopsis antarctica]|uniref:DNA polymerase III subunit epsilon n=1 Tax=Amycolatopsis antarctica TaxID=1854586 RepID=A0A263D690_9PSEU|nr:exonuclease domain-containing protein [Amycolatopsis antarctica]OZM74022.1 DNA polymerase III subunit epsilon [Amycolatopsis antarctica]